MVGSRDRDRNRERERERHRDNERFHKSSSFRHSFSHNSRRSPEYNRNDNNSEDECFDNTRRHRSQQDRYDSYDGDRRLRDHRRDRSRSRDRDRDCAPGGGGVGPSNAHNSRYYNEDYNNYSNNNNNNNEFGNDNYDRDRDRDRSYYQRDRREEIPNNTIMIRGLAPHICENDIIMKLAEHSLQAKDIRLMRKKETGVSRGFAFVEFTNIEHAIQWKEATQGIVVFSEECEASVHYSIPKDSFGGDKNIMKNDWSCYKCGVNNFKRREECFKCGTPKEESMANDTGEEISLTPTNALLLRNLSPQTTEERILTILGSITALPIKSIRILKDPTYNISRGVCLVELHTTLEASQLFTLLSSMNLGFVIDDYQVTVNYGKRNASLAHIQTNTTNAAIVALAAAQWRNLEDDKITNNRTVYVNGIEYEKYEPPVVSSFQFDESSGYYYDSTTGFYYDSNTQYYYNPQNQQYMYWDAKNETYLAVESKSQASDEEKKEKSKDVKQDKVKIAKKIAKDMEKWAKTLNQKKETARSWNAISEPVLNVESAQTSYAIKNPTADAGFSLLEQQVSDAETELLVLEAMQQHLKAAEAKAALNNDLALNPNPYEIIKAEEERLTDWEKLACLLCKRQFPSSELLTKHQQLSELHKNNLMVLKRSKLSEQQIEELERSERDASYRDRAKERRKKYGIPETPDLSKLKGKYLNELEERSSTSEPPVQTTQAPISEDNIGNKMLKAMGWTEGTGLGKANQGMSNIIEVERRKEGVGLGMRSNTFVGESYKEAVRRTMQQRFKDLNE